MKILSNASGCDVVVDPDAVKEYVDANGIGEDELMELTAALYVKDATVNGAPGVFLIGEDESGTKVGVKVTLNLLLTVAAGLRGRAERDGWRQPP